MISHQMFIYLSVTEMIKYFCLKELEEQITCVSNNTVPLSKSQWFEEDSKCSI